MKLVIVHLLTLIVLIRAEDQVRLLEGKRDENVDDLKDLLMASIQNTIALNEVITQQTQKISETMLSLAAAKIEIQEMKMKLAKNEIDDAALATKITEMEGAVTTKIIEVEGAVTTRISTVEEDLSSIKEEVGVLSDTASVTVLNGEETNGDPKCAKVCSGTTGRRTTNWVDYSGSTGIYTEVDISGCGFVKVPTVTTSIEGTSVHWEITGTSAVYDTTTSSFEIYLAANRPNTRQGLATVRFWNVDWIAVGFTC